METICQYCKNIFVAERKRRKFCSSKCCYHFRTGKLRGSILSNEAKAKISKARQGIKLSRDHKKAISTGLKKAYAEGRKGFSAGEWTPERKKSVSDSLKIAYKTGTKQVTIPRLSGKNHPNWQGGITPYNTKIRNSVEMQKWKKDVFSRDNYTCLGCGDKNREGRGKRIVFNAHHIKPLSKYPDSAFYLNNGMTLCKPCHDKTHYKGA